MKDKPPGGRNRLSEYTRPECDYFREHCNFTPEELAVFNLRTRDKSIVQVCFELGMSDSTVTRRIRSINRKIKKLTVL